MAIKTKPIFPFTAVVGQSELKTALLLATIDTQLGGVLVSGPRGSAKSTLARGLIELPGDDVLHSQQRCQFVTLPLGASEEQLIGSLDLDKVLGEQKVQFSPGLLAKAHQGVLYIDEVNLLPDNLVDLLLDASALGVNYVERDGVSHSHPAEFTLIGTMNPDEGEIRPQLLDRFGLAVKVYNDLNTELRVEAVRKRLAFDADPQAFCAQCEQDQHDLRDSIGAARALRLQVQCPAELQTYIATQCLAANVDGLRGDIIWQRAAIAYAALKGCKLVSQEHCDAVAEFVLSHRRHASEQNQDKGAPPPSSPPPPEKQERNQLEQAPSELSLSEPGPLEKTQSAPKESDWGAMAAELQMTEAQRTIGLEQKPRAKTNQDNLSKLFANTYQGRQPGPRTNNQAGESSQIHWFKTLSAKENRCTTLPWSLSLLKFKSKHNHQNTVNLVLLDTSASTLGGKALGRAKGLITGLSKQAYEAREQLAILAFGNQQVHWVLRKQRPAKDCKALLKRITGGGGTPLRQALLQGQHFIRKILKQAPGTLCRTILITDGRTSDCYQDLKWPWPIWVVDTEKTAVKLGKCRSIAQALKGTFLSIDEAIFA